MGVSFLLSRCLIFKCQIKVLIPLLELSMSVKVLIPLHSCSLSYPFKKCIMSTYNLRPRPVITTITISDDESIDEASVPPSVPVPSVVMSLPPSPAESLVIILVLDCYCLLKILGWGREQWTKQ